MEAANLEDLPVDLHGGGNLVSGRTQCSSESVWLAGKSQGCRAGGLLQTLSPKGRHSFPAA